MKETSIAPLNQFISPPQKEKRIKYVSRHMPKRTQVNSLSGVVQEEVPVVKDFPDVSRHVPKRTQVNSLSGVVQEEVLVVKDSPDVFPEELPGMPPDRDIEFLIELLPGTGPVSKRPYRMPAKDLEEIKTRIKELLEKGYIRLSPSPWEP